jgi:hypothetical protein
VSGECVGNERAHDRAWVRILTQVIAKVGPAMRDLDSLRLMTSFSGKEAVRHLFDAAFNKGDLEPILSTIADDYVDHSPIPAPAPGAAGFASRGVRPSCGIRGRSSPTSEMMRLEEKIECRVWWVRLAGRSRLLQVRRGRVAA